MIVPINDCYATYNYKCLSYTLGSSEQKADIDEEPLTLESRASLEESLGRVR